MGSGRFDDVSYRSYTRSTEHHTREQIYSSRILDPYLDPKGKNRESRDSADNPESTPIIVGLDITGSMGHLAEIIARRGLGVLFNEILKNKPVTDPHIMFMGIGDANFDQAPLQVSQFEADNRIVDQLTKIWLENGGGGNAFESYNLAWYFAGKHTSHDAADKRGKKGYLFTVGDEEVSAPLTPAQIRRFLGDEVRDHVSATEAARLASKLYHVFHIIVQEGRHAQANPDGVLHSWTSFMGQQAIPLADHTHLAEVIVATIEVVEGRDKDHVAKRWGGTTSVMVQNALKHFQPNSLRP